MSLLVVLSILVTVAPPPTQVREALSSAPATDLSQIAVADAAVGYCSQVFLPVVMRGSGSGGGGPDFALLLNPDCVELSRGGNVTAQVNLTALNGFSGTVNLTLEGAAGGITGTFSLPSVNTSGSSNLSLSVGSGVLPGTYLLSVKGASGSLVRTATLMLIVQPPVTIVRTSPANGENEVAVTRETIVEFGEPISLTAAITDTFSAQFGGQILPARRHLSPDRMRVTLFYSPTLPASARVRVTVAGDNLTDDQGALIDADGDGVPGGVGLVDFDTLSLSRISGTDVWGYVYDSYNKNLDGTDRPVISATIRVDGFPEANVVTNPDGYFILRDMPAPMFFVHIDGSTATNAPPGTVYATVGKPFHSVAGQSTQLTMDGAAFNIYLPPMSLGDVQNLSSTQETDIGFGPAGTAKLIEMFPAIDPAVWDQTQVMFPPNSAVDDMGNPATQAAIIPVPADRLPAPLSPGLNHQLDIAVMAMGATNFDTPAPACFPNLPDPDTGQPPAPGEKAALISFNHDTGMWEVAGSMTVSVDGKMVCTDPGVGIRAPGWHGSGPLMVGPPPPLPPCSPWETPNPARITCAKGCLESAMRCVAFGVVGGLFPGGAGPGALGLLYCLSELDNCINNCERDNPRCVSAPGSPGVSGAGLSQGSVASFDPITDQILQIGRQIRTLIYPYVVAGQPIPPNVQSQVDTLMTQANELAGGDAEAYLRNRALELDEAIPNDGLVPPYPVRYVATIQRLSGILHLRGQTGPFGQYSLFVPRDGTLLHVVFYDSRSKSFAFVVPHVRPDAPYRLPHFALRPVDASVTDFDYDGLIDLAELVYGANAANPDSDGDGIRDGPEVDQGTDPLDGLPAATGIIATSDTPGTAVDIAAFSDLAVVADSDRGVSVLSVVNGTNPVIIAQVDTPGNAQAVAFFSNLVAVADGAAGLAIIDVTDPPAAQIVYQLNLGGTAQAVTTAGRVAYVGLSSGQVVAVDMVSGTELGRVTVGSAVQDVALGGDTLYVLTRGTLHAVSLDDFTVVGSAASPGSIWAQRSRLFVGGGIAYATHIRGYNTFSLANPAQPVLIAAGNTQQAGWGQIVANGSGLGVAVVGVSPQGDREVYLYDVSNPAQTNNFLTAFQTPGVATAASIYNGLAYIADGQSGLQVINYLAYDSLGISPTITLSTNFAPGLAEEGKTIRVTATVTDDVQVRNVEFYVDGVKAATDGNFPFEHRFTTPLLSQQPSFTLRAKATDTGGNLAWTDLMTVTLVADATPPQVRRVAPQNQSVAVTGSVSGVSASFSEPISTTTITSDTLRLFGAGPDGIPGTADDVLVIGGVVSYRDEVNTALLTFSAPLPVGLYRAVVSPPINDLVGNPLAGEFAWTFRVKDPVYWISDADGFWDTPSNWSTGSVPQAGDTVIIDRPASNITVTHRSGTTFLYNLYSAENLVLSGGSLSISATAQISNAFTFSGGALSGSGDVLLSGPSTWTGGTMSGPGATNITVSGTLVISGTVAKTLNSRILNNAGSVIWRGTGNLDMNNGAVINNLAGGLFDAQNDAVLYWGVGVAPTFNNAGLFRKSAGAGTTTVLGGVTFSGGNVEVLTGTLSLAGSGTTVTGGVFTVASGAVLDLGSRTYVGNFTGSGAGAVRVSSGTLQVGAGGATFNFPGSLFQWTGGALSGPGILTNSSTLNLGGASSKTLSDLTLTNAGNVLWSGAGAINLNNGAVVNNLASGIFEAQDNASIAWGGAGAAPTFNNAGLVRKSGGTGTTTFGSNLTFSGGNVEVLTGTLSLAGNNTTTTGGNFTVASGAVLDLTGGFTRVYVGNYTGTGAGTVRLGGGTLQVGAGGATFNFPGSLFQWTGGTLSGPGILTNTSTLNLSGANAKGLSSLSLNNAGSVVWTGTGNINLSNGSVLNNLANGIFEAQDNASIAWGGFGAAGMFNNAGLVRKSAGAGTTTFGSNVAFTNTATVNAQAGVMNFAGSYRQITGTTSLSGGNIAGSTLNIQGGSLSGAGLITATVAITGQVNPGGLGVAGVLTITGNYIQAAAGVLNAELGGLSSTQYDRLAISGSATLTGTLDVSLINAFVPSTNDSFQVMTYGSRTGMFATVDGHGQAYTPNYNPNDLTLVAQ